MAKGTADTSLTKAAHLKMELSKQELLEFRACCNHRSGPLYFMENFMKIQHPTRGGINFEPFDYQLDLIENYNSNRYSINMLGRQMGKALDITTPILTPEGFKPLGDLMVGDLIYGDDGKTTRIQYITETMYDRPCYQIDFSHGESVIADAEHLWTIVKKNREMTVTTLEMIELFHKYKDTSQSIHIRHCDALEFDQAELPLAPYILGLWLGDGGTSDTRITCHRSDYSAIHNKVTQLGYSISEFRTYTPEETTGNFTIYEVTTKLKQLNVWGHKHIPQSYLMGSKDQRLELLRGLMDSDGTAEKHGPCRFSQSNLDLIKQVRFLLSSLGIKSTLKVKQTTHKDSYTLHFTTTDLPVFCFERKLERQIKAKNHPKNKRIYIRDINQVESVPVRCLQVDNQSKLFLCGETLIPTHNTTVAAGYLLWYAMFRPDSTILVAAHKATGANEIMQRIRYAYESCPDHIRAGVVEYNKGSITFDNGSRIVSSTTTETTGRGMSLTLVYLDEFAFVRPTIAKEFWTSLSPTLATGGKCIVTSTPNSDDDTFANIWRGANKTYDEFGNEIPGGVGVNGFKGYMAKWDAHPDRDEAWANQERNSIGEERFRREHQCEFVIYEETLIDSLKLIDLHGVDPIRHMGQVRWYQNPHPDRTYVVSLDPSAGTGGDPAAIQVIELPTLKQVAEWQHNKTPVEGQVKNVMGILQYLREIGAQNLYWSVENNTIGEAALVVIRDTGEENFPGEFLNEPKKQNGHQRGRRGFHTGHKSKVEACLILKRWIENDKLKIYSKPLISEFKTFVAKGNSYAAKPGDHDDLVMSLLLAVRMIQIVATYEDAVYEAVNNSVDMDLSDYSDEWDMPFPTLV